MSTPATKPGRSFYKAIIFCSHPLKGYYRFKDIFQIYPLVSDLAPKSDKIKYHPAIIEYWIDEVPNIEIPKDFEDMKEYIQKLTQATNYLKNLLFLLSTFSNYRFFYPTPEFNWFLEIPDNASKEEIDHQISKVGLSHYYFPEINKDRIIKDFTPLSFPKVQFSKHPDIFVNLDLIGKDVVQFSEHIDAAFHNYFALQSEDKSVIIASASLICNGVDTMTTMKSLSFISFVSSIENMVNYEYRDEKPKTCESCGQQSYRVTAKFRDYLLKYASNSNEARKQINFIYGLRSKIVHNGFLLLGDNLIDWSDDNKKNDQEQAHLQAMQVSRLSLTNWLLTRGS
jgi:hypothetical protein